MNGNSADGAAWHDDLARSADAFEHIIWPTIREHVGGGRLIRTERQRDALCYALDTEAGVDYVQCVQHYGVRGLAARVQAGWRYSTFTVRAHRLSGTETEFSKRIRQLDDVGQGRGWIYPVFTVQAYLDREWGTLQRVAVVNTQVLYEYLQRTPTCSAQHRHGDGCAWYWQTTDNAGFAVVPWAALRERPGLWIWRAAP